MDPGGFKLWVNWGPTELPAGEGEAADLLPVRAVAAQVVNLKAKA